MELGFSPLNLWNFNWCNFVFKCSCNSSFMVKVFLHGLLNTVFVEFLGMSETLVWKLEQGWDSDKRCYRRGVGHCKYYYVILCLRFVAVIFLSLLLGYITRFFDKLPVKTLDHYLKILLCSRMLFRVLLYLFLLMMK